MSCLRRQKNGLSMSCHSFENWGGRLLSCVLFLQVFTVTHHFEYLEVDVADEGLFKTMFAY